MTYYSTVTDDLKKDHSFAASLFPDDPLDYSLKVIQIAEGDRGELFLYVYQPSHATKDLRAIYINMSLESNSERTRNYKLYSLTWLSGDGTLAKYLVNGVTVSKAEYRYYNIASIYRSFDSSIDENAAAADDLKNAVAYPVATCFGAYYYNDVLIYESERTSVVDIEILAVGSVRYNEGFKLYLDHCDSHFVAFKVENYDVDRIYDATITYSKKTYTKSTYIGGSNIEYGESERKEVELSSLEKGSNDADGLFAVKYEWNRIVSIDEFETQLEDFKNEDVIFNKGDLGDAEFVFQFLETSYSASVGAGGSVFESGTSIEEVGILRLHFLSDGKVYNLGVVSDLVSDDGKPDFVITIQDDMKNVMEGMEVLWMLLLLILALFAGYILISFFAPWMKSVLNVFLLGFKVLPKVVWGVLTFVPRLVFRFFKRE